MIGSDEKLWLLLDGVLKRLVRGKFWTTSADEWNDDIKEAISSLKAAIKKIEKNIEKKSWRSLNSVVYLMCPKKKDIFNAGGFMDEISRRDEVEALKKSWLEDPIWDLESTEGFEEFRYELFNFRVKMEKRWERDFLELEEKRRNKNYEKFNKNFSDSVGYSDRFLLAQVYKSLSDRIEKLESKIEEMENE